MEVWVPLVAIVLSSITALITHLIINYVNKKSSFSADQNVVLYQLAALHRDVCFICNCNTDTLSEVIINSFGDELGEPDQLEVREQLPMMMAAVFGPFLNKLLFAWDESKYYDLVEKVAIHDPRLALQLKSKGKVLVALTGYADILNELKNVPENDSSLANQGLQKMISAVHVEVNNGVIDSLKKAVLVLSQSKAEKKKWEKYFEENDFGQEFENQLKEFLKSIKPEISALIGTERRSDGMPNQ